jgi:DSF synthase
MRDIGVVDELVEDGTGAEVVKHMIAARQKRQNSYRAMAAAKRQFMPIQLDEMVRIVSVWVDAAMRLETRDLRMMARLVRGQDRMLNSTEQENAVEYLYPVELVGNA